MLGIGGKFASSKGMVKVPDLVGLSRAAAKAALSDAGLKFGTESSVSNDLGSSYNGDVSSQTPTANTLVEYETVVSFNYYKTYVPPVYVTGTQENCVQNTRLVYLDFEGREYGPCVNGVKTVTSYRSYDQYISQTCTLTTYYSDGTSSTSPEYSYPEVYYGVVILSRNDGVQAC